MRLNKRKMGLLVFVIFVALLFRQYHKMHFAEPVIESLKNLAKGKSQNIFTDPQAHKISTYFLNLESKGYTAPKFSSFYATDENRLYILVETSFDKKGYSGISYIVVDYDADGETIKEVLTSGWIKTGETIKNF